MPKQENVYKNASKKVYELTDAQRSRYREIALEAQAEKKKILSDASELWFDPTVRPAYRPENDMPRLEPNGLKALSLFSGGGGLDLGFDLAGFDHVSSYELIPICGETLQRNRPDWEVFSGPKYGDVSKVDWSRLIDQVDVVHGGPPCQPFSIAGSQGGENDERNMWPEFARCVNSLRPKAFVAENVLGIAQPKFKKFVERYVTTAMSDYDIVSFTTNAAEFGVPQARKRVFFVGARHDLSVAFCPPKPTHRILGASETLFDRQKPITPGVRAALGLPDNGFDGLAPTLRSGFTGKRNTTSILNSSAGQEIWKRLGIWPNGVQLSREAAQRYPARNQALRLSVQDCALLQGFPESWIFTGAAYQVLGQIGNSVAPPVAYHVARSLRQSLLPSK